MRIIYIAAKRGFVIESFKVLACLLALFLSFHVYSEATQALVERFSFLSENVTSVIVFVLFFCLVWGSIYLIRKAITALFKIEPHQALDRWFCAFFGLLRAVVVSSVFIFLLYSLEIDYLER
ncbi:CvpA family protein, partial [Candidatus Omnitrophota bacterium]